VSTIDGADPCGSTEDDAWREITEIDARLERGEIDEAGWHNEIARLIVPAYLAAATPWEGSGKSGGAEDREYSRSHIADALDRNGSFLDVGCANGYLLESLARWTPHRLDLYGLDIAPELVALARKRLPAFADHFFVGNALQWEPPQRFTFIRTGLEYVPRRRRRELVQRLLGWCDRLIIGVFAEDALRRTTEEVLRSWGHAISGRSDRAHPTNGSVEYRIVWIDSSSEGGTDTAQGGDDVANERDHLTHQ
jgi:SAM-dependent methyltransferase